MLLGCKTLNKPTSFLYVYRAERQEFDYQRIPIWLTSLRYGKSWLAQCQDNATEWEMRLWYRWPGILVRQDYKVGISAHCLSQISTHHDMTLDIATT